MKTLRSGPILTIQAALKLFGDKGGNIINISSGASKYPLQNASLYSSTKAALDAFTIALSKELGVKNVRINSILPGATETEGATSAGVTAGSEYEKMFVEKHRLAVEGSPQILRKLQYFWLPMTLLGSQESKFPFRAVCMVFKVAPQMEWIPFLLQKVKTGFLLFLVKSLKRFQKYLS